MLLREIVRDELQRARYDVVVASDGAQGLAEFRRAVPDLVLLDLILPDRGGFSILCDIRAVAQTPVIILTSRDQGEEKVTGLDLGADDYVTKPFRVDELMARIRANLRKSKQRSEADAEHRFGEVEVDFSARTVDVAGRPAHLTPTEFRLLEFLIRQRGRALQRERLLAALTGGEAATAQALQTHISRLREKLGPDGKRIRTVWGIGYRLDESGPVPTTAD